MNGAVVVKWGNAVRGRETKALEVFGQAIGTFDAYAKAGRIYGHQEFIARTGKQNGFMLITGDLAELTKILGEDDVLKLNVAATTICEDFEINLYEGGTEQAIMESTQRYAGVLTDLGYLATT